MGLLIEFLFSPSRPIAFAISLLILGLSAVAFAITFLRLRAIRTEDAPLTSVEKHLSRLPKDPDRESWRLSTLQAAGLDSDAQAAPLTLIQARILDLERMGERHEVDVGGLTALNREALRDSLAFPTAVGPILVLLGLVGTLFGLGISVTELASTLGGNGGGTLEGMRDAILGTLGGMQTAFSTTLLGIVGTVAVRSATGYVRHQQSGILRRVERLLVTRLVPLYEVSEKTALPEAAAALTDLNRNLQLDFELLLDVLNGRGRELTTQLEASFTRVEESFQRRAEDLLAATGKAMSSVLDMLGQRHEGDPSLAEYVQTVQSTTSQLQESVRATQGLIPELETRLQGVIELHRTSLESALTAYSNQVGPILENQARATAALVTTSEASADSMLGLKDQLVTLSGSFERARSSWERIDELVDQVGEACSSAIASGLHDFVVELQTQSRANVQERERLATAVAALQSSLSQTLDRLHDDRTAAQQRSLEVLQTTREVVTSSLERILASLSAQQQVHADDFVRAIRELTGELRDLAVTRTRPGSDGGTSRARPDFAWDSPRSAGAGPAGTLPEPT